MTLGELRQLTREWLDDLNRPYRWSDTYLNDALNAAVDEAAQCALLIVDRTSPEICRIDYTASTNGFRLHSSAVDVQAAFFGTERHPVYRSDVPTLARRHGSTWYLDTGPQPAEFYISGRDLYVHPTPSEDGYLTLWMYRRPFDAERMETDDDVPAIPEAEHRHLPHWACYEAYLKPDPDTFDRESSQMHAKRFERHFGPRPSARLDRMRLERGSRTVHPRSFVGD